MSAALADRISWGVPIVKAIEDHTRITPNDPLKRPMRLIKGYASVDEDIKDIEGEIIDVSGIDDSIFMMEKRAGSGTVRAGVLTWEHSGAAGNQVGRPLFVRKSNKEYYIEGYLFYGGEADAIWTTLANNPPEVHGYGFSLDGKVVSRSKTDPGRITKCILVKVAITPQPMNPLSWIDIVKSLDISTLKGKNNMNGIEKVEAAANNIMRESGEDETVKVGTVERILKAFTGRRVKPAAELVKSATTSLAKSAEDMEKKDEDDDMEKCVKCDGSMKKGSKFCAGCGNAMKKSLQDKVEESSEAADVLDATPYLQSLTKSLSESFGSFTESHEKNQDTLVKALAASLLLNEKQDKHIKAQGEAQASLQKSVDAIAARLGIMATEGDLRKSATGETVKPVVDANKSNIQVDPQTGYVRAVARSAEERAEWMETLKKAWADKKLEFGDYSNYSTQLGSKPFVELRPMHKGLLAPSGQAKN